MIKLTPEERIYNERIFPYQLWLREMRQQPPTGLKWALVPLLTDEQKYFTEYLPHTEIRGDCEFPEPHIICPKCKCHSPQFSGGDSIMHLASGMVHYSFWKCLNPDCNHWWMLEDGEDE